MIEFTQLDQQTRASVYKILREEGVISAAS